MYNFVNRDELIQKIQHEWKAESFQVNNTSLLTNQGMIVMNNMQIMNYNFKEFIIDTLYL
jgi:hypothetical protein